jgi:hypothetical protein
MARFSSLARSEADFEPVKNARLQYFGRFFRKSLEELNTYSGRLTSVQLRRDLGRE